MGARGSGSPGTPGYEDKENDGMGLAVVGGSAVTPMKRVPILANFEEWMKMATDNVRGTAYTPLGPSLTLTENQRCKLMELCAYRLFSRHVIA